METTQHQEWRARQHLSIPAVLKSGFATGLLFFFLSGGTPWSTAGTMNAIMGRDIPMSIPTLAIAHLGLSLIYALIIGVAIYRLKTPAGVVAGVGVAIVLYGANLLIFRALGGTMQSPEVRPIMVHLLFGLFASLLYKAFSVPKPLPN